MDHSTSTSTFADIMSIRTRDRQHRPLLTVYDDTVGTRTELSYATVDNWAAKSANLLVEELELGPGATVALDLDGHWTTAVLTLACWKAGIAVTRHAAGIDADLVCCHTTNLSTHDTGRVLVVGDGLRAEPVEPVAPRAGLVLLGEDVHAFADDYDGADVHPTTPALVTGAAAMDHAGVVRRAQRWRGALGDGARVGLAGALDDDAALLLLAGVVAAGGSVVTARAVTTAPPWDRWETERVTVAAGTREALSGAPEGLVTVELTATDDA